MSALDPIFFGNSVLMWLIAAGIFVVAFSGSVILKRILRHRIAEGFKKSNDPSDLDHFLVGLIDRTKSWFLLISALTCAGYYLDLSVSQHRILRSFFVVSLLVQIALWGDDALRFFLTRLLKQRESKRGHDPALLTSVSVLQFLGRLALYVLIFILILDNLGFNVTTLVAGLGVGGIAVALAAQNILGDLFASLSIVLDKPFVIGDFIDLGAHKGRVEKIGLKTTRLRSLNGEQIIISNTDLLHSRILNFARMEEKRIVTTLNLRYETKSSELRGIPDLIKKMIEKNSNTRVDRIYFKGFSDSALVFEAAYFVTSRNPADYVTVEEQVNFDIFEAFEKVKIQFAYPTRTLRMEQVSESR